MKGWYVDDSCIECGLCIEEGEGLFDFPPDGKVYVKNQPEDDREMNRLFEALAASCPSGSIKEKP